MCNGENSLIEVRPLQFDDRSAIQCILKENGVFTIEEIDVALELIDSVLNNPNQKDYTIFSGVNQKNEVVGYYCVGPTPLTDGTYDLYWIAVNPSYHNRGIGKHLLQHAEDLVMSEGGRLIVAETSSQPHYEQTRRFYLINHYQEIARIKDYYKLGDDLVIFGKYLSQSGGV